MATKAFHKIAYKGRVYVVEILQKPQKNLYMRLKQRGIVVTIPLGLRTELALDYVRKQMPRFASLIDKQKATSRFKLAFKNGYVRFLNENVYYQVLVGATNYYKIMGDKIYFYCASLSLEILETLINKFFFEQGEVIFQKLLDVWLPKMGINTPVRWKQRKMISRWGVCHLNSQQLVFNTYLVHFSEATIAYVVIHEIAHFKHPDHSPAFWQHVADFCPDYKYHKSQLRSEFALAE